jgi:hypothetical protein
MEEFIRMLLTWRGCGQGVQCTGTALMAVLILLYSKKKQAGPLLLIFQLLQEIRGRWMGSYIFHAML